jgi:hypothetical protein
MAPVTASWLENESAPFSESSERATSKETEGRRAPRHSRKIAAEGTLDPLPALALGIAEPDVDAFIEALRRDADRLADVESSHGVSKPSSQSVTIGSPCMLESLGLVQRLRRLETFAPRNELVERKERCSKEEPAGGD